MPGVSEYPLRRPGELSGGQRQRVAMGRALARDASTFLFDDPLSDLDARLRGQMRAELAPMRRCVQENMIHVTHDQAEAVTPADRIEWNECLLASALADRDTRTVPVLIVNDTSKFSIEWSTIMAAGMSLAVPPILTTLFASRQIITGMTVGAVKC